MATEEEEYRAMLESTRHEELLRALDVVANSLKRDDITLAFKKNEEALSALVKKMSDIAASPAKEVAGFDASGLVAELKGLGVALDRNFGAVYEAIGKEVPLDDRQWVFEVKRDPAGLIDKIIANKKTI